MDANSERHGAAGITLRLTRLSPMARRFLEEVSSLGLSPGPGPGAPVRGEDIAKLPESVRRYLIFMGVMGRPRDWSFRLHYEGRFRQRPLQVWAPCSVWQYNTSLDVARVFHLKMNVGGLMPTVGRDTYVRGHGRMLVRLFDVLPLVDATGSELDTGELVTYLNDAILLAPSMLLGPATTWVGVDDDRFDVSLTDQGRTVTARVTLDSRGAPTDFSTEDRYCHDPFTRRHPLTRARWSTPVSGWSSSRDRPLPTRAVATWHLPGGDFEYVDVPSLSEGIAFNLPPGI
nr:hypothetical protein [Deltaproteobacteria bacterium]